MKITGRCAYRSIFSSMTTRHPATENGRLTCPARAEPRFGPGMTRSRTRLSRADRKSVVSGKSVSVRVDLGGRRIIQKKKEYSHNIDRPSLLLQTSRLKHKH